MLVKFAKILFMKCDKGQTGKQRIYCTYKQHQHRESKLLIRGRALYRIALKPTLKKKEEDEKGCTDHSCPPTDIVYFDKKQKKQKKK